MALRVEVAGYGLCRTTNPCVLFIIQVQQDKFEAWTVYRRLHAFVMLREQIASHHPQIAPVPGIDATNFNPDYLEHARVAMNNWLGSLAANTYILRMQPMYQFLCMEANMPPPYLEVHMSSAQYGGEDMDMEEMFEGDHDEYYDEDDEEEEEPEDSVSPNDAPHSPHSHPSLLPPHPPHNSTKPHKQNRRPSVTSPRQNSKKHRGEEDEAADDINIQSISFVRDAELTFDVKDAQGGARPPLGPSGSTKKRTISLEAFKIIKVIGKGSFGKVFLVRDKQSSKLFAMKVLKKDYIFRKNQVEHTKTERNVLGYIHHPFIVGLNMAFQTGDKLFFVLDYCAGGELFFHLGKVGQFPESRAKFYAAQITLALEYVHQRGVIYRDLKPENVLLDEFGNVKLTDFGLSKEGVSDSSAGATSFCGTPEYIAPEVLLRQGHGRAVDWWSLGALLFEMITGLPPFYSRNRETMFQKIMSASLDYPPHMSEQARSLLGGMLVRDPKMRLGSGERDAEEIKSHAFFADMDWPLLASGKMPPPWIPRIASSLDTSQFDSEFTSMLPIVSPDVRDAYFGSLDKAFEGFTFVDDSAAQHMARSLGNRSKISSSSHTAATMMAPKKM